MIAHEHELHRRRWSRNLGLGLVLGAFVVLIFGLTVAKVSRLDQGRLQGEAGQIAGDAQGQSTGQATAGVKE